jgi:hypothetical protein
LLKNRRVRETFVEVPGAGWKGLWEYQVEGDEAVEIVGGGAGGHQKRERDHGTVS